MPHVNVVKPFLAADFTRSWCSPTVAAPVHNLSYSEKKRLSVANGNRYPETAPSCHGDLPRPPLWVAMGTGLSCSDWVTFGNKNRRDVLQQKDMNIIPSHNIPVQWKKRRLFLMSKNSLMV